MTVRIVKKILRQGAQVPIEYTNINTKKGDPRSRIKSKRAMIKEGTNSAPVRMTIGRARIWNSPTAIILGIAESMHTYI